jgi:ORF6N domain
VAEKKNSVSKAVAQAAEQHILQLRGVRVMLAADLAQLYEVETRVLLQSVRRNIAQFPEDFAFSLTNQDLIALRSQIVISNGEMPLEKPGRGGARYTTMAFTEQGIAMLSSVLKSDRAIAVNIEIMRTFVKLRGMLAEHEDLKRQLATLERKYDGHFKIVFDAIKGLMEPPAPPKKRSIGFVQDK